MPIQLSTPLVVGLLTDLELRVPKREQELQTQLVRAAAVEGELQAMLGRFAAAREAVRATHEVGAQAAHAISDGNTEIGKIHQDVGPLQRRVEGLREQMSHLEPDTPVYLQVRRQRAALQVQIDTRLKKVAATQVAVQAARDRLVAANQELVHRNDALRGISGELDALQNQLPAPRMYMDLFEMHAARAHCRVFLDHAPAAWRQELLGACRQVLTLHEALRAGRYRLDANSDVVGGRAVATSEAMQACVALGEWDLAREIFTTATDPNLFFHHIYNVYRVWALGLYLNRDFKALAEMLRLHQDSQGSRGAYARAFLGFLTGDNEAFQRDAAKLVQNDWLQWQKQKRVGLGVINVGALALHRIAREQGMGLVSMGPSVPQELLQMT